jgi:hypothetical protein
MRGFQHTGAASHRPAVLVGDFRRVTPAEKDTLRANKIGSESFVPAQHPTQGQALLKIWLSQPRTFA